MDDDESGPTIGALFLCWLAGVGITLTAAFAGTTNDVRVMAWWLTAANTAGMLGWWLDHRRIGRTR